MRWHRLPFVGVHFNVKALHVEMHGPADIDRVDFWDPLVQRDPAQALAKITATVATGVLTPRQSALAWRAASRCLLDLGRIDEAKAAASSALEAVEPHDDEVTHTVVMSASVIFAEAGDFDQALSSLDRLAARVDGVVLGRVRLQTACVLMPAGRLGEALALLDESEQLMGQAGEPIDQFRVLFNRGFALLQLDRLDEAENDFRDAGEVAQSLGMTAAVAQSHANRGVLHGRARRLVEALKHFARATELFEECGNPGRSVGGMEIDRAEVLLHSGLFADAVDTAHGAVESITPTGNLMLLGDALLVLARCEMAAGRSRAAARTIQSAIDLLRTSGRPDLLDQAASQAVQIELSAAIEVDRVETILEQSAGLLERLTADDSHPTVAELAAARIAAARSAGLVGRTGRDLDLLREGLTTSRRDRRLYGWYAKAVDAEERDDPTTALEACDVGLAEVDTIAAEAANLADRSAVLGLGERLSSVAISVAASSNDAVMLFAAAEGMRARALHDELGEQARHRGLSASTAQQLLSEIQGRLAGDRAMIEWVVVADHVFALVIDSTGPRVVDVGDLSAIVKERDRLLVWLDRAAGEPDGPTLNAARAAGLLDNVLIGALGLRDHAGLVIVPSGLLHGVPWSGLRSLAGRAITLCPSAQVWIGADRRAAGACRKIGIVTGPALDASNLERRSLERLHPGLDAASGQGATAASVRSMLSGHDVVHIAAHGIFRSDRPVLSTIELAGGSESMFDVIPEQVRTRLVVLSSCEGGAQGTADGSEVLGFSSILLARGAASVLAPLTVVRDLECGEFVSDVHEVLVKGVPLAEAVAQVRGAWLDDDDLSRWAVASSFTCFGSGATRLHPT